MAPPHGSLARVAITAALAVVAVATATSSAPQDAVIGRALQASALGVCADPAFAGRATLASGGMNTCALTTAGVVLCWGSNEHGISTIPASVSSSPQAAVVTGPGHVCSLSAVGVVGCWGYNSDGQTTVPVSIIAQGQLSVAVGYWHTCTLSTAGRVSCWGRDDFGQTAVPASAASGGQIAVASGFQHVCALSIAGGVSCWGRNDVGQASAPSPVASGNQVAVTGGGHHSCSLSTAGAVSCWGLNSDGQSDVPASISSGGQAAVTGGGHHTCALSMAGAVSCWGQNTYGQTSVPTHAAAGGHVAVAAGYFHTCAISFTGAVSCWGAGAGESLQWPHFGHSNVPSDLASGGAALPCRPAALILPSPSHSAAPTLGSLSATGTPPARVATSVTATHSASVPPTASATATPTGTYRPGVITTVAGSGIAGFGGDGGPATSATLNGPAGLIFDRNGDLLITDYNNHRVRRVAAGTGLITTLAGTGSAGFSGDGGPATSASLYHPTGLAVDGSGNVVVAELANHRVRLVAVGTRFIATLAGTDENGYSGDGGPATSARLNHPRDLAFDSNGNLLIADTHNHRIRRVAAGTGLITTLAGTGVGSFVGDGGSSTSAGLFYPHGLAVDDIDNVFIADTASHRIRKVAADTGVITTLAGTGVGVFGGDDGPATSAGLYAPYGLVVGANGDVLISDRLNHRIRRVAAGTSTITTLAGTGAGGFSGDGGPATNSALFSIVGLAIDHSRNSVLIADYDNHRVRMFAFPSQPTPTSTPSPSATPYCQPSLFRPLPRTDLVGSLVGTALAPAQPVALPSEAACRQACCDAAACDGYSFDASSGAFNPLAHCFLFVNVTQLIPSNTMASGVRESALL